MVSYCLKQRRLIHAYELSRVYIIDVELGDLEYFNGIVFRASTSLLLQNVPWATWYRINIDTTCAPGL